jgi:hypothetical protein
MVCADSAGSSGDACHQALGVVPLGRSRTWLLIADPPPPDLHLSPSPKFPLLLPGQAQAVIRPDGAGRPGQMIGSDDSHGQIRVIHAPPREHHHVRGNPEYW